jgi:hypothetical protein
MSDASLDASNSFSCLPCLSLSFLLLRLIPIPITSHSHSYRVSFPFLSRLIPIPIASHSHSYRVSFPFLSRLIPIPIFYRLTFFIRYIKIIISSYDDGGFQGNFYPCQKTTSPLSASTRAYLST